MQIACHRIQCKEQKEKKQKHFWCVRIKFILVMTSCSAVHIKTKRLLCSRWEFYLCAMTLPVLNHDVLLTLPKTMVCLKVFKKIQLLLFSYMVSYAEYGKSKNTARVLLTLLFSYKWNVLYFVLKGGSLSHQGNSEVSKAYNLKK